MNFDKLITRITSGEIPTGAMLLGGIVMFILALKVAKGLLKFMTILVALALFAGAAWWHFHKH